ncbi:disease resistance protein RPV1-like [Syzygium oleosum]|uniref:disease resistance protein RPV1-like n=1 Tax=Syzygium oleosum TaxID=219896 RepID=UPI0024B90EC7|nr:disease resistance protein RPV1-like [Syzygium oleosum]XP_056175623.1 disease resistance protein RPV1-like [Syzygium oleosum]
MNSTAITFVEKPVSKSPVSSDASPGCDYDVFLSFRGPDSRKGFTSHLYQRLQEARVRVFRDDDELPLGEEIGPQLFRAIDNSKISIPVLSECYASSKWCLSELARMLKCKKEMKQVILPIFYKVEPADVKWLKGTFGDVFNSYTKRRFGDSDVQEWRQALKEVGSLKGLVSENIANGNEAELIEWVVVKVLSELKNAFKLVTPKHLVGVDIHVKKIMTMVDTKFEDTRILGIHGMGGAGKTTLAKIIYNELSSQFERHGFLADIRETESRKGIVHLQKELISEVLKGSPHKVSNRDHGINIISSRFGGKRVLIFLDDVSDKDQLDALVGGHEFFGFGSRIIITTRDKAILNQFGTSYWAYELMGLDKENAMVLFCRHAFQRDFPPPALNDLCRDIVSTTGQLPLALEVIGSLLCDKPENAWREVLKKLRKVPYKEVEEKLKISYDMLTDDVKQIFLDIACFFNGTNPRLPIYMWDDCGFSPNLGLEVLSLMSLVKIVQGYRGNRLWMHDQLRDLGRSIISKENRVKPSECSRLWIHGEAFKELEKNEGTDQIEALHLDYSESLSKPYCLTNEQFRKLPNLRYLRAHNAEVTGDFKDLRKLRWLDWMACETSFSPANFPPENLIILNVRVGGLTEHCDTWHHVNGLEKLKVLRLLHCYNLIETPDFSTLQNLEILNLEYCVNLVKIHPSIRNIRNLISLSLTDCEKLKELPKEMGCLTNLTELLIDGSSIQEIPVSIGRMRKLEIVSACNCRSLVQIDSSIGSLRKLHSLLLDRCRSLSTLPDSIGKLKSLTQLSLSESGVKELPQSIGDLHNLKVLLMARSFLRSLPRTVGRLKQLEELDASGCKYLQGEIPSEVGDLSSLRVLRLEKTRISGLPKTIHELSCLQVLDLGKCEELQSLPGLPSSLTSLYLVCQTIPDIANLINLTHLSMKVEDLSALTTMKTLSRLAEFQIELHDKIEWLPDLPSNLLKLEVSQGPNLERFPDLSNFKRLSELHLRGCSELTEIKGLEELVCLTALTASFCEKLYKLEGLGRLVSLRSIIIRGCKALETLPDLSKLKFLKIFDAADCENLVGIQGLDRWEYLEELDISVCYSIESLPDFSNLKGLKILIAGSCLKLVEITGLDNAEHLKELNLSDCSSLERLPELPCLGTLKNLYINGCEKIRDIQALREFSSCKILYIEECKSIVNLPDLSEFEDLEYLTVKKCRQLADVPGLDGARSLKFINISGCEMLENLPDLSGLELLEELKVRHCGKITELQGLGGLRSLSFVDFSGCNLLKPPELPSRTRRVCSSFNPFDYENPGPIVLG